MQSGLHVPQLLAPYAMVGEAQPCAAPLNGLAQQHFSLLVLQPLHKVPWQREMMQPSMHALSGSMTSFADCCLFVDRVTVSRDAGSE